MMRFELGSEWSISGKDGNGRDISFKGSVPGCVHTDLIAAGYIDGDIFFRDNAKKIQWIEDCDWVYTKEFEVLKTQKQTYLCFEGLDTYCDIYLNGKHLGYCDDMFIPHRFNIDSFVRHGEKNSLEIRFYSPVAAVRGRKKRDGAFTTERLYTRRMQCTYGWDWVYRFVTCGVFRPVYLEYASGADIKNVYINTESIDEYSAQVSCEMNFEGACLADGHTVCCKLYSPDGTLLLSDEFNTSEESHTRYYDIPNPQLWSPFCCGEAPLYTIKISIGETDFEQNFGIRTVKILQLGDVPDSYEYNLCRLLKTDSPSADEYDANEYFSCFNLLVNGKKVFCKGANWVPCEPFPSAEKNEKITKILELAKKSGLNMIRVWGGGLFECDHFYSECDRLGIMVTQDFLMACGSYPEDDSRFIELLSLEAEHAALRLRNHPCLMWWTGDNENAVDGNDKMKNYKGRTSAYKAIAPALRKYDPRRRFLPSSPYGGDKYASKTVGTTHNTQYLSYIFSYFEKPDLSDYKEVFEKYLARFVAEEPVMGACNLPTLRKFMTDDDIFGENTDMWHFHNQSNPALSRDLLDYNLMFAEKVLGKFENTTDRFFKLKYIAYEWIRITLEKFRRNKWFSGGIIYWMLNDCWPASCGWALIDYYCRPKPSYYAFRRCSAKNIVSVEKSDDGFFAKLCSDEPDGGEDKKCLLTAYALDVNGGVTKIYEKESSFACGGVRKEKLPALAFADGQISYICDVSYEVQESNQKQTLTDRAFYKDGALEITECKQNCDYEIIDKTDEYVIIRAKKYIHAVEVEGDTVLDDNYFSLVPGETRTVKFEKPCGEVTVTGYTLKELFRR